MNSNNKGFSLIELMIVIAIIGVLAAIAVPSYQTYVMKSKVANLLTYIQAGQLAIAENIVSTGNTDCNFVGYDSDNSGVPNGLFGYWYGNSWCGVEADGLASDFGGNPFYLYYYPHVQDDGSITWSCHYTLVGDQDRAASIAPQGCQPE